MFKKSSRVLLVTLLLFVLAGSTYAFAAQNVVGDSFAGDGEGKIGFYNVKSIQYTLADNPVNVGSVSFVLDQLASEVQISFDDTAFFDCSLSAGVWTCTVDSEVSVLKAEKLRVIAVQ
ncbi:MAG: hypothetical protein Q7U53_00850 [Anaerolineaceae bacterium]|nr:hypothetical protein [Anaerolineaceae bacterium]